MARPGQRSSTPSNKMVGFINKPKIFNYSILQNNKKYVHTNFDKIQHKPTCGGYYKAASKRYQKS